LPLLISIADSDDNDKWQVIMNQQWQLQQIQAAWLSGRNSAMAGTVKAAAMASR